MNEAINYQLFYIYISVWMYLYIYIWKINESNFELQYNDYPSRARKSCGNKWREIKKERTKERKKSKEERVKISFSWEESDLTLGEDFLELEEYSLELEIDVVYLARQPFNIVSLSFVDNNNRLEKEKHRSCFSKFNSFLFLLFYFLFSFYFPFSWKK